MKFKERIVVEEIEYADSETLAKAYGEKTNTIEKRYYRDKRGNDLIKPEKRKNYIPPEVPAQKPKKFIIGELAFDSEKQACRELNISYNTYRKRLQANWSKEEALNLVPRKDGRKTRARKHKLGGFEYTETELSNLFGKPVSTVRDLLKRGATVEQAVGLKEIKDADLIPQSLYNEKHRRKRLKINFAEFDSFLKSDQIIKNKDTSSELLNLYVCKVSIKNRKPAQKKHFYKIGITGKARVEERFNGLTGIKAKQVIITFLLHKPLARRIEEKAKRAMACKRVKNLPPIDGRYEFFELSKEELSNLVNLLKEFYDSRIKNFELRK